MEVYYHWLQNLFPQLALRAGNEKEEGETADTVGCCSLRKEHLTLHEKYEDQEYVVEFDFLGKDSIRYYNRMPVEKRVFKNLQLFMDNKAGEDDVFDRLNVSSRNIPSYIWIYFALFVDFYEQFMGHIIVLSLMV